MSFRQAKQKIANSYKDNHRSYETLYALFTFEECTKIADGNANASRGSTDTNRMGR